jgi:hypothetical protein
MATQIAVIPRATTQQQCVPFLVFMQALAKKLLLLWRHKAAQPLLKICSSCPVWLQALAKKLLGGSGVISCMAVHPGGDHVIVGSEDKRLAWWVQQQQRGGLTLLGCRCSLCRSRVLLYTPVAAVEYEELHVCYLGSEDKRLAWCVVLQGSSSSVVVVL